MIGADGAAGRENPRGSGSPVARAAAMEPFSLWLIAADPGLRARWGRWLAAEGFSVEMPASLSALPRGKAGSVLLDAALLKEQDLGALKSLSESRVPVIVFGEGPTASNESVVRWLQAGADDFIPASIQEKVLIAKLQAFARRVRPDSERTSLYSRKRRIKADVRHGRAWTRSESGAWEETSPLTSTELKLLALFLSLPETLLERGFILQRVWGEKADDIFSSTLTQHIMSLRRKLGTQGEALRTVYGRGYALREE